MAANLENALNIMKDPAERLLIKHQGFRDLYDEIKKCFDSCGTTADPKNLAIVGPSGAGKSTVATYFENQHPVQEHAAGDVHEVLQVRIPSGVTRMSLAATILRKLKEPYPSRGSLDALTTRVDEALTRGEGSHGIRLVILNEFQRFIDSTYGVPYETADWLKDRIEVSGIPFIVLGLDYGLEILDQNEQLFRLFPETIEVKPFSWENADDRKNFRGILQQIRLDLTDSYQFPFMERVELAFRCHYASFGLIGYLMKIVRGAAELARDAKKKEVSEKMLSLAYEKLVRKKRSHYLNPFSDKDFDPKTAPPPIPPSETAAERRASWRERSGGSRMPIRRDRTSKV